MRRLRQFEGADLRRTAAGRFEPVGGGALHGPDEGRGLLDDPGAVDQVARALDSGEPPEGGLAVGGLRRLARGDEVAALNGDPQPRLGLPLPRGAGDLRGGPGDLILDARDREIGRAHADQDERRQPGEPAEPGAEQGKRRQGQGHRPRVPARVAGARMHGPAKDTRLRGDLKAVRRDGVETG